MNREIVAGATDTAEAPIEVLAGNDALELQILVWIYRLLFLADAYKAFVREKDFSDDELAQALKMDEFINGVREAGEFDQTRVTARLRSQWKDAEQAFAANPICSDDCGKVMQLGRRLGLGKIDCDILAFRVACERRLLGVAVFHVAVGWRQVGWTLDKQARVLSVCLGHSEKEIRQALSPSGALLESGILTLRNHERHTFEQALDILACITEELSADHVDPLSYFRSRIIRPDPPRLTAENFPHVASDIEILSRYLQVASATKRPGVNVLIHGEPGTGKSEFPRMLAAKLGLDLLEVAATTRFGQALDGEERFRAFRLGQSLLAKGAGYLMVFDEIEDVFVESDRGQKTDSNHSQRKAWINRLMEGNPVPTFWITNNTRVIDPAFLRRFDYVLELTVPPLSVRSRVLDGFLADLPVSAAWKRRMAEHEDLAPAVLERAANVVRTIGGPLAERDVERMLSRSLGNTLDVMGLPREPRYSAHVGTYRLDLLNADCVMTQVESGLKEHQAGRICLYGPPGTGKTAFGRHIAEILDRPLLVRRASDIVSPWLGMTERNLARMFQQAQEENAVLLLDEADSFLQDRRSAQRTWEVTEVNEMLTQMESFEGVFIASTNLMDSLDAAALRRFDLKIRLDYLEPAQAWVMFVETRTRLGIADDLDVRASLTKLGFLTPGDFANVARQARLRPIPSSLALLERLRGECAMKPEGKRAAIGFAA